MALILVFVIKLFVGLMVLWSGEFILLLIVKIINLEPYVF